MKTFIKSTTIIALTLLVAGATYGQRGRGETEGLARQGVQPDMVRIEGTLDRIETGPCPRTTGRAYVGTHLFIEKEDGRMINLHVGSADAVKPFVDKLETGRPIEVTAFRTDLLEEDHYVAKEITFGEETLEVRADDLSPFWSRQRGDRRQQRELRPGGRGDRRGDAQRGGERSQDRRRDTRR